MIGNLFIRSARSEYSARRAKIKIIRGAPPFSQHMKGGDVAPNSNFVERSTIVFIGGECMKVTMRVNGMTREADIEPRWLLVHVLREKLGLTGTNVGCDTSQCGSCTVLMNGMAVKACNVLGVQADGADIVTIEGLKTNGAYHPVQQAFWDNHGLQCGFCTPGMIMTSIDLLREHGNPSDEAIRHGLDGNLCRCTGYENIVRSVRDAAEKM
jgi:carbon-monoxide dehydrogenase small subunit